MMDKFYHFLVGFGIGLTFSFATPKEPGYWRVAPMVPVTAAAVGKEIYDREFDELDVLATVAGGLTAIGIREVLSGE